MVNLSVIKKLLKEDGVFNLFKESVKNIKYRLKFNQYLFVLKLLNKFGTSKIHTSGHLGHVFVVICMDIEGPNNYSKNNTWSKIMIDFNKLSKIYPHIKLSLFIADWIAGADHGYTSLGHHTIFDRYSRFTKNLYWHYHHPSYVVNKPIVDWNDKHYENIINKKIIDRNYFPSLFRAGYTFEGPKAKKWLNKWIPFDFSSRAPYTFWENYYNQYSPWGPIKLGRRTIFRSLDAENLDWANIHEVDKAFSIANLGEDVILSFFTHDYKDFIKHINYIDLMINLTAKKYPTIQFYYMDALTAIRKVLKINKLPPLSIQINKKNKYRFIIRTNRSIYQRYPYIAIKQNSRYTHKEGLKRINNTTWELLLKNKFEKLGVAVSDKSGYTKIKVINYASFND